MSEVQSLVRMEAVEAAARPVMLYDGECGMCSASVQFILARERRQTLLFAPSQGTFAGEVRRRHPELAGADSVIWLEPARPGREERAYIRSDALLRVAAYLGLPWSLLGVFRMVPRSLRDAVYRVVARNRHRWSRGRAACIRTTPQQQARFLDHVGS